MRALAAAGHDVTFTYRSAAAEAEALLGELASNAIRARHSPPTSVDLADKAAVDAFAASVGEEQPFSGFVHNAGQSYDTLAVMMDQAKAEAAMQVNFWSFTRIAGALVRPMMRARDGRIVVIGSVTALQANQGNAAYAASKAALLGYVRTLAIEIARTGVTVNYVAPGFIDTEMLRALRQIPRADGRADPGAALRQTRRDRRRRRVPAVAGRPPTSPARCLPVDGGLSAAIGIHR